ncbi:glycosyltransferase family 4 protein [Rhodococcus triatomae]|uniref:Phosphatidylinositol alpha-mannosyltransferase n=1 Tax=Rhodococcus triatomae TaxID=300028 RepID=A0A1G8KLU3_9NOCA|nr:glycosyltransferase family 4 protein [Rhodococcus triatomae]QNG18965.1 glycosyltransferase family 4 protein [Rhodococcus triatomae]QNG25121.1 glycosyltransferase family 4 protein [Rhodococcus triatomae]SDI44421.1 phosphatidylinositol alpha-mannosyltransferase [Rhodococcus triatomae]
MRIGMICPYSLDVPGGVQAHVVDLARVLIERGHQVSVLAPSSEDMELPDFVVSAGRALPVPYNGSVARLSFTPTANARVRRWISDGDFDVLHIHEPNAPSLSMLALRVAEGPIVATFHTSTTKSLVLSTFQSVLQPYLEKISGRIAVSELARRWQVEALGSDAVEIPNGVDVASFADAPPLPGYPRAGGTIAFLGRYDEPRKGMAVLLRALPALVERHPDLEVLVIGRGDEERLRREAGPTARHLTLLGQVDDKEKASALRSADVYCAPNLGGESFGIVLVEAMSAGTAVVASELDAFRRVLQDGRAGILVPIGDGEALAEALDTVLSDTARRDALVAEGRSLVTRYDWPVVAEQILRVYETVAVGGRKVHVREVRS